MWSPNLEEVRARASVALTAAATVTRKASGGWLEVGTGRPCMVERQRQGQVPDSLNASSPTANTGWTVSFAWNEDVQEGDRLAITGGMGAPAYPLMTVGGVMEESLSVYRQVMTTAAESAVESFVVTIERWSDLAEAYQVVTTLTVQASLNWTEGRVQNDTGAQAAQRNGVMVVPAATDLLPGDSVYGLPWGGAEVTGILPEVAGVKDVHFIVHTAR